MEEKLSKLVQNIIKDIVVNFRDKELNNLIKEGKISYEDKVLLKLKLDLTDLYSRIEDISIKFRDTPRPDEQGEIIASEFSVMFEIEDAMEAWKEMYLNPKVSEILKEEKRG